MPESKLNAILPKAILPVLPVLIQIAEEEILKRMGQRGQTRDEVLAEATTRWEEAGKGADDLANLGHPAK